MLRSLLPLCRTDLFREEIAVPLTEQSTTSACPPFRPHCPRLHMHTMEQSSCAFWNNFLKYLLVYVPHCEGEGTEVVSISATPRTHTQEVITSHRINTPWITTTSRRIGWHTPEGGRGRGRRAGGGGGGESGGGGRGEMGTRGGGERAAKTVGQGRGREDLCAMYHSQLPHWFHCLLSGWCVFRPYLANDRETAWLSWNYSGRKQRNKSGQVLACTVGLHLFITSNTRLYAYHSNRRPCKLRFLSIKSLRKPYFETLVWVSSLFVRAGKIMYAAILSCLYKSCGGSTLFRIFFSFLF